MYENRKDGPMLVGTVALDILHDGLVGDNLPAVTIRWGGVVSNMACALGVLDAEPQFVSVSYDGEMLAAVANHLRRNSVRWLRLPAAAPLPLFHARLTTSGVSAEHFIGEQSLEALTPKMLMSRVAAFNSASVIVSCTDLPVRSLSFLARMAAERSIPYWLLSADASQAVKLHQVEPLPSCIALNIGELSAWYGMKLSSLADAVEALQNLLPSQGRALLTLGSLGALLVTAGRSSAIYQPASPLDNGISAVGAGDVMFGSLLAARLVNVDWATALTEATSRTASYLSSPTSATRPYLALRNPRKTPPGRTWRNNDDMAIRFQPSPDIF